MPALVLQEISGPLSVERNRFGSQTAPNHPGLPMNKATGMIAGPHSSPVPPPAFPMSVVVGFRPDRALEDRAPGVGRLVAGGHVAGGD